MLAVEIWDSSKTGFSEGAQSSKSNRSYSWDFGDGQGSKLETPQHQYTHSQDYTVTLIAEGSDCIAPDTFQSTVTVPTPKPYFEIPILDSCECKVDAVRAGMIETPYYFDPLTGTKMLASTLKLYRRPISEQIDTVPKSPLIRWDNSLRYTHQVAIITKSRPTFDPTGALDGVEEGDWMWHSGMNRGYAGELRISDGRRIKNITNQGATYDFETGTPDKLEPGVYFWMIYAFDELGIKIAACSRIHVFEVLP